MRRIGMVAVLLSGMAACGQEITRSEHEALADDVELRRIDNGDGTWSFELPEDFDPSVLVYGKILTWRYVEQARFSHAPTQGAPRTFVVPEQQAPRDARERLLAMRRVDSQGRVWMVEDVDDEAWTKVRGRSPDEADLPAAEDQSPQPELAPGTEITWTPLTWTHSNCVAGGGIFSPNELHIWDTDGRDPDTTPLGRQRTAVQVQTGLGSCSGVIIDNDEILTAAHCVSDDNNNPVLPSTITVCKPDPWTCFDATDIDFSGEYGGGSLTGGGTDFGDDWAIIELTSAFAEGASSQADHMHLSTAADSTLEALTTIHNISFPAFEGDCTGPIAGAVYHNAESEEIADVTSERLKLRIDASPGQSGSPIYYCPAGENDVCGSGDMGHVIGVLSGYDSVADRVIASKVADFEAEAQAFIND